ncbi:putative chemoreceptor glutamine deamidase cheD [Vibrio nigripulchritudo MADA3029]|uniref:Probable chemoreceptor glutamine deamidase CheD n=1 Tax=Vibrio nigripulchritudo TaxID=28173 RepID=U4KHU5_9VIBR|nr:MULTISPECIES: chemotaxis protein CheD [Vibrio]EGU57509.1 chemoreceptor glutamine deamidase CheD [Vibrio nigripulchritudo ATCC 27043]KJY79637.1 chemotaxis protein CheD [Vibrio nigripulchritudo]UAB73276.1 chemotaxis protein CheD [Vibrio sp. SCSIO 43132]CCN36633.1 putative chemoreceptor glutamine deamidase cheD [Vibrio nigripulchritudo AM115]CCN43820.1 putative chemoreceptor glutamine deamidase cheD [Vibrio nigripulchritudo FTn2]
MKQLQAKKPDQTNQQFARFYHQQKKVHMVKVLPGGVYTSREPEVICTGLGSCIAACMWDPHAFVGGMNHFLLPFDSKYEIEHWHPTEIISTASRYGNNAMEMLINQLLAGGAVRERIRLKLFGGAQMMGKTALIGDKNIEFALNYARQEGFEIDAQDLGGMIPRKVMFDPLSGQAWVKRIRFTEVDKVKRREAAYAKELDIESHRPHDDDAELF